MTYVYMTRLYDKVIMITYSILKIMEILIFETWSYLHAYL